RGVVPVSPGRMGWVVMLHSAASRSPAPSHGGLTAWGPFPGAGGHSVDPEKEPGSRTLYVPRRRPGIAGKDDGEGERRRQRLGADRRRGLLTGLLAGCAVEPDADGQDAGGGDRQLADGGEGLDRRELPGVGAVPQPLEGEELGRRQPRLHLGPLPP